MKADEKMGLFRDEVLTQKTESLHGAINLALPLGWQLIAVSLAAIVSLAALFLFSASYSRTEIASGTILPTGGILQVVPPKAGRVEKVLVREGQMVRKGEPLAQIRAEQTDSTGAGTETEILSAIERQQQSLEQQQALTRTAAVSEQGEYTAQISGLRQEVNNLDAQIAFQEKLVDMARVDLSSVGEIAKRGFISRHDLAEREEALLSRRQELSVLRQTEAAKLSGIAQANRAQLQAAAKASDAAAALATSQAQIERERATAKSEQGISLIAPLDGAVAALSIDAGQAVDTQNSAMAIIPSHSEMIAELYIPGKAAGFVRAGQAVRLALDAYPYERFGTVAGTISILSAVPVMRADKGSSPAPFYIATVVLKSPSIQAYGRRQMLLPGMTCTAHILVEHRSLLQWLFDPLLAAAQS